MHQSDGGVPFENPTGDIAIAGTDSVYLATHPRQWDLDIQSHTGQIFVDFMSTSAPLGAPLA